MKKLFMFILAFAAAGLLTGCVSTRTYVVNKDRVDQDIPGMPNKGPVKTRKMIVLEVVEKDKVSAADLKAEEKADNAPAAVVVSQENNFALPEGAVAAPAASTAEAFKDYVVQKGDTLQKIAKQVYGSYNKWTKIYEANRTVIKDPNFLRPGITIKLPVVDKVDQPAAAR